ncbi:MAG: homoserine O-succinyltransferase [Atopobiaceae bacterium]|jgi:homoserine O-succinyltransferase|nr:homoserine O-succinyltransferase [Atopobiaceae bacterium]MCH4120171.1 homoserine O-succinyltransferase [Atopobiaceae bacterium]MCI1389240.1 homoserine O-succinyltransferase [Atopobiaceae bacterium]MCI1432749.1 homoserine O-succinyltransferase [Atopobiaceae bacterium]MCI1471356.1 homoserine O-succinyltransferase [Atopobiaceae bacterium]
MPIRIPDGLPAKRTLHDERIFALEEDAASNQRIRPLKIAILNLMPKKIETETQILRLLSKSSIQTDIDFMRVSTHESTHVSKDHLVKFYDTFDAYRDKDYDGLIVTGAPVEQMEFEEVDYWDELCEVMDWSQEHVFSTMYLCWGALAGLWHLYGIPKRQLPQKLFGVFPQRLMDEYNFLTNGFDEVHAMPHSRHAAIDPADLKAHPELEVLSKGAESGPALIATPDFHEVYVMGHFEYGRDTLAEEYRRDIEAGLPIEVPEHYFPGDDPSRQPIFTWRAHANLLYRNWVNWVYQMTPYDISQVPEAIRELRAETYEMAKKF